MSARRTKESLDSPAGSLHGEISNGVGIRSISVWEGLDHGRGSFWAFCNSVRDFF